MTKPKLTILTLIILVLGLVVSGCAKKIPEQVGAYPHGEGPFAERTKQYINVNIPVEGEVIEADIDGWKTYMNEGYGFKISYPGDWESRQFNYGSSYKTNCVAFERFPKTIVEMNKYNDLIVNFYICKVYNVILIEYLQDLGYQIDSERNSGKISRINGGVKESWLDMDKVIFNSHEAIKFLPENPRDMYSLYMQREDDVYFVKYSAYPDQYSKEDLEKVVNTMEFLP